MLGCRDGERPARSTSARTRFFAPKLIRARSLRHRHSCAQDDDLAGKVATGGSIFSGFLFSVAWAIFLSALLMANIDCIVWGSTWSKHHITNCSYLNESDISVDRAPDALVAGDYFIPGILSSFGLILLNVVSWEAVVDEGSFGESAGACAKVWILCALIFLFAGFGLALWAIVTDFANNPHNWHAAGICTFIQTLLILISAFVFRFSRRSGDHAI